MELDYLTHRAAMCEQTKAAAQEQMLKAQALHERAEGGRLVLTQLHEELRQVEALVSFLNALFGVKTEIE